MIRAIIFAPLLFVLVLFALSNPQAVHLGLWPTDFVVDLPLSIAILLSMAVACVGGALLLWLSAVAARLRARRAEAAVKTLEAQVAELKKRLAAQTTSTGLVLPPQA